MKRVLLLALAVAVAAFFNGPLGGQVVLPTPVFQAFDNNGDPCSGCRLYIYTSGTTEPAPVFRNRARSTPHTSPIVLDAAGRRPIFLTTATRYDVVLRSPNDVAIWSINAISFGQSNAEAVTSAGGVTIQLDSNNNDVNAELVVLNGAGEEIFKVEEDGEVTASLQAVVADETITAVKLAPDAVTESKLADDACGPSAECLQSESLQIGHYAPNSIPGGAVIDGTLTGADIADGTLTGADVGTGTRDEGDVLTIDASGNPVWQQIGFGSTTLSAAYLEVQREDKPGVLARGTIFLTSTESTLDFSVSGNTVESSSGGYSCGVNMYLWDNQGGVTTVTTFYGDGNWTLSAPSTSYSSGPYAIVVTGRPDPPPGGGLCTYRMSESTISRS